MTEEIHGEIDDWYVKEYNECFRELEGQLPEEDFAEVMQELITNHNKKHSEDGKADAKTNFIAAYDAVKGSGGLNIGKEGNDFLDYVAKTDGKSRAEVNKWARDALSQGIKPKNIRR